MIGSGQCGLGSSSSPPSNYIEGDFETLFSRSDLENSFFDSSFFTAAVIRYPLSHLGFILQILQSTTKIFCKSISLFGHQVLICRLRISICAFGWATAFARDRKLESIIVDGIRESLQHRVLVVGPYCAFHFKFMAVGEANFQSCDNLSFYGK